MRSELDRPDYHVWFMEIALVVATRSTCCRRAVGCVIADRENRILATGYNGVPSGVSHCTHTHCSGAHFASGEGLDSCQAIHAEVNAVARLADVRSAFTLYCTTAPCISCTKMISATPIQRIVANEPYAKSGMDFWTDVVKREWIQLK